MASPAANRSREAIRVHTEILEAASRGEEVGGDHVRRVVAQESRPALAVVAAPAASGPRDHVPPDRPRRDPEAELGEQLVGDALLSPQGVLAAHLSDPPSKIRWNGRSSWPGLPPPEEPEAFALPTDQGLGSDHDESASPVQPAAEQTEHRILTRHRPARPLARARAGCCRATCRPPRSPPRCSRRARRRWSPRSWRKRRSWATTTRASTSHEIDTEWYAGSLKGAVGTLRQGAGNDVDQASLLIVLFPTTWRSSSPRSA